MSQRRNKSKRPKKNFKIVNPELEIYIESDEYFGFIAGYTTNGIPYGLKHDEFNLVENSGELEIDEYKNDDKLPF